MLKDFDIKKWDGSKIIIYGAGRYGRMIAQTFLAQDIHEFCFCDKKLAGKKINNICVISADDLPVGKQFIIIIGAGRCCAEIYNTLKQIDIKDEQIFTAINLLKNMDEEETFYHGEYAEYVWRFITEKFKRGIYLTSVDLVITECCTLKCKYCSNLMQYYKKPQNIQPEILYKSFQQLLRTVDFIGSVRVLGGEPFVNQALLIEVISKYADNPQIGEMIIITNGTLCPNKKCLEMMRLHDKVQVAFSNYGVLSDKTSEAVRLLQKYGIKNIVLPNQGEWIDYGKILKYHYTEEQYQKMYKNCWNRKDCNTLLNGYFYLCPRAANGTNLGILPIREDERVNMLNDSEIDIRQRFLNLINRKEYLSACMFCNREYGKIIERAEQVMNVGV